MRGINKFAVILALTLLLLASAPGCGLFRQAEPAPEPDGVDRITFSAVDMFSGETLEFPGDFEDEAVYLVFFADG